MDVAHATQSHCSSLGCLRIQEDTTDFITGLGLGTLEGWPEEGIKEMGGLREREMRQLERRAGPLICNHLWGATKVGCLGKKACLSFAMSAC